LDFFVAPRICRAAAPSEMEMIGPIGRGNFAGSKELVEYCGETPQYSLDDAE
jgi:hypothetical protein